MENQNIKKSRGRPKKQVEDKTLKPFKINSTTIIQIIRIRKMFKS